MILPFWMSLGWALAETGRLREAIDACQRALDLTPDFPGGHCNIGWYYLRLGEYQQAIEAERKALAIEPDKQRSFFRALGQALAGQGDNEDAQQAFKRAVEIKPEIPGTWHNLGHFYLETGQYSDAVQNLEKALQLKPNVPNALHSLGLAHLKLGDTAAALTQCELLSALDSAKAQDLRDQIGA